jgi:hypothetical protein
MTAMSAPKRGADRFVRGLRVGATSLLLTMRLFGTIPSGRSRPNYAIERELDGEEDGTFDPREVISGRVVLTLPISEARESRPTPRTAFNLN